MTAGSRAGRAGWYVATGVVVALALAVLVAPFASDQPDGLERVAIDQGFAGTEVDHRLEASPLADYGVAGVDDDRVATGISGAIGVLITFAVGLALLWALRALARRRSEAATNAAPEPVPDRAPEPGR